MTGQAPSKEGILEAAFSSVKAILPQAKQAYKERRGKQPSQESNPHNPSHVQGTQGQGFAQRGETFFDFDFSDPSSTNKVHPNLSPPVHITPSEMSPTFADGMNEAMVGLGSGEVGSSEPLEASHAPKGQPKYANAPLPALPGYRSAESNDMRNIEILLIKAGYDFEELRARKEEETVEEAVRRFLLQYRQLAGNFKQANQKLHQARHLTSEHKNLQVKLEKMETELNETRTAWHTDYSNLEDKKIELFHAQQRVTEQSATHVRELNNFKERIARLNNEHERALGAEKTRLAREKEGLKLRYEENIRNARAEEAQRQEATIQDLTTQLDARDEQWTDIVDDVRGSLEKRLKEAEMRYNTQQEAQDIEHYRQIRAEEEKQRTMIGNYEAQIAQLRSNSEDEKSQLRQEIQNLRTEIEEEQQRSSKELKELRKELNQKHKNETARLKKNYEEVKLDLFDRKHFKGLRDRDLTGQFSTIVGQVRDFANLDWDVQRETEWPFEEDQLLDIHRHNIRKLKKQLLQNTLWIILYNFVFRTPFQILGMEGRELDSHWIHIHKPNMSSLEWPDIPTEIETQRFETAKAILAIMEPSVKASGRDLRLKSSYESAIEATLQALYRALNKIAYLETRHQKTLQNLVRLCAKTWMQFCSQPYRLIVTLPSGSGDLLSSPQRNERALTLVISPELKRYGNSQGENLTRGEVVPDCQAAVQTYPTR